jgi:hypothetical protein
MSSNVVTRRRAAKLAGPLAFLLLATAASAALPAAAQSIKPGLWQISNKMSSADPQTDQAMSGLLQQLGNLTPDQRQRAQQLAAQNGVSLPQVSSDGGISVNACVTPEMAAKQQIPMGQQGNCTSNNVPFDGGLKMSFSCTNPVSSGQGTLTYNGDSVFHMLMNITTSARGAPEQVTMSSTGTWLGASCPAK